jgi:hypothetical protein
MNTKEFSLILRQMADNIEEHENCEIEPTKIETWQHLGILYLRVPISYHGCDEVYKVYRTYKFER